MPFVNDRKQLALLLNAVTNRELAFRDRETAAEEISERFDPKRHGKLFADALARDDLTDPARETLIDILALMADEHSLAALEAFVTATNRSTLLRNEAYLRLVALGRVKPRARA